MDLDDLVPLRFDIKSNHIRQTNCFEINVDVVAGHDVCENDIKTAHRKVVYSTSLSPYHTLHYRSLC